MLISLLGGLIYLALGAAGWFIAKFLAEPLIAICALRMEAQETLIRYGNLQPNAPAEHRDAAAEAFGDVGAKLSAHGLAARPWVKSAYRLRGWDIYSAGGCCLGIGAAIKEGRVLASEPLWGMAPELRRRLDLPEWPKPTDLEQQLAEEVTRNAPVNEGSDFHGD